MFKPKWTQVTQTHFMVDIFVLERKDKQYHRLSAKEVTVHVNNKVNVSE